ncbi:MAG TPA: hypothetical protein VGQ11_09290 [Candidatus Acidoferrales bacterium]|jgi:protein ImuB|nr:hypothetical protein [Candidatus Acidoferrales bacterium]
MPYACIYVADFPAEAILRGEPALRGFALVVLDGQPPLETLVAMNEFARRAGVQPDMPRALLEQCPSLLIRRRSAALEAAAEAALLETAETLSPRVERVAADTLALDLAGLERLFGSPEKIAAELSRRVAQIGLRARIGVAANPDAAMIAARGFSSGVTVIAPGCEAEILGRLPVSALSGLPGVVIEPDILETLERWGIRDFRALAALPTAQLSERLGQPGIYLQQLARGESTRVLIRAEPVAEFTESLELECAADELEPLSFLLGRLLDELCARLAAHALATNEIRVRLELDAVSGDVNLYEKTLRLPVPMRDSKILLNLLRLYLAAHPPDAPIRKMTLTLAAARPRTAQGGLFAPLAPDPQKLEVTLARIAGIVGAENVGAVELLDTHRDTAFRMRRFGASPATVSYAAIATRPDFDAAPKTALRVFRPPPRAVVELRDAVPARISFAGLRGKVRAASGPWHTSGDWWQPDGWQHDVWDIEIEFTGNTASPARDSAERHAARAVAAFYRIYFNHADEAWFVRGEYD